MSKIPPKREVQDWYNEVLKTPSFVDTLNEYQKDKLWQFAGNEIRKKFERALGCLGLWGPENYPKDLPKEGRLNHILFTNLNTKEPIYILNLLGWNWSPERSFHKIEEPTLGEQPEHDKPGKEIVFDPEILPFLIEGLKEHFPENQRPELKRVLEGGRLGSGKLIFAGNKNQLPELAKCLVFNGFIVRPKEKSAILRWLVKNFTTTAGDLNPDTVHQQLTKKDFYIHKGKRLLPSLDRPPKTNN